MTTPLDIITAALKDIGVLGVGQTPLAEDVQDAFQKLNWMIGQWNRKRYLIYSLLDVVATCTGQDSYTFGPGGDFDVPTRPDRLEGGFFRQLYTGGTAPTPAPTNTTLALTPTGSPFVFMVPFNGTVVLIGGTVSQVLVSANGSAWEPTSNTAGPIQLGAGQLVEVVYSSAPAITIAPIDIGVVQQGVAAGVTPTASPFVWIAPAAGTLLVTGGTVSAIAVSLDNVHWYSAGTTTAAVPVAPGTYVRVTYSMAPTLNFVPLTVTTANTNQPTLSPYAVDYPIAILESRLDYNRIGLKSLSSFTYEVFYDPQFPYGIVWPYPVPMAGGYELHLTVKMALTKFASLGQDIILPEEYMSAIHYNLAVRLAPGYQRQPRPDLVGLARDALNVLRMANTQIPRMTMPSEILRPGIYNVYSDRSR